MVGGGKVGSGMSVGRGVAVSTGASVAVGSRVGAGRVGSAVGGMGVGVGGIAVLGARVGMAETAVGSTSGSFSVQPISSKIANTNTVSRNLDIHFSFYLKYSRREYTLTLAKNVACGKIWVGFIMRSFMCVAENILN